MPAARCRAATRSPCSRRRSQPPRTASPKRAYAPPRLLGAPLHGPGGPGWPLIPGNSAFKHRCPWFGGLASADFRYSVPSSSRCFSSWSRSARSSDRSAVRFIAMRWARQQTVTGAPRACPGGRRFGQLGELARDAGIHCITSRLPREVSRRKLPPSARHGHGAVNSVSVPLRRPARTHASRAMTAQPGGLALDLKCRLPAPRARVFKALTKPDELAKWWGPHGFTSPSVDFDADAPRPRRCDRAGPRSRAVCHRGTACVA
jgi:hypothetical protein